MAERVLATSDCERCRPGFVTQPANTVSSLAYVAAGMAMLRHSDRTDPERSTERALAWATIAAGAGSAAYHGPGGSVSRYAHDAGLIAMLGFIALSDAERLAGEPVPAGIAVVPLVAAVGAMPRLSPATQALAGLAAAVAETARLRWAVAGPAGDPVDDPAGAPIDDPPGSPVGGPAHGPVLDPSGDSADGSGDGPVDRSSDGPVDRSVDRSGAWSLDRPGTGRRGTAWVPWVAGPALAVGLAAQVFGRTGGPWCRPDSLLQPHALWHVLTAGALWARSVGARQ